MNKTKDDIWSEADDDGTHCNGCDANEQYEESHGEGVFETVNHCIANKADDCPVVYAAILEGIV